MFIFQIQCLIKGIEVIKKKAQSGQKTLGHEL